MENFLLWLLSLLNIFLGPSEKVPFGLKVDSEISEPVIKTENLKFGFSQIGLNTNTNVHSIPLEDILNGGPSKDGIPALTHPTNWEGVEDAKEWLDPDSLGVLYEYKGVKKFYPYELLYWHEIVNDKIGDQLFTVTFCPLCGSVVVYSRSVDDQVYDFGVSGKLWESNLLMYDRTTESLWSQITGEAVVGNLTGKKLEVLSSQVLSFEEILSFHSDAQVLNTETGFERPYGTSPYGDYEENEDLYFPVSDLDKTFHPKTIFYIVDYQGQSVGFHLEDLKNAQQVFFYVNEDKLLAEYTPDKQIYVSTTEGGIVPGYFAMWFSWMTHQEAPHYFWSSRQK